MESADALQYVEVYTNLADDPRDKAVTVVPPTLFPDLFRVQASILGYTTPQIDYMIANDTVSLDGFKEENVPNSTAQSL